MRTLRILSRNIRDAFKSVGRNFSLSLASISCISITLIVVALALLVAFNVENFSQKAGNNVTIVTYLQLGATEDDLTAFEAKLNEMDNVVKDWEKTTPEQRRDELISQEELFSNIGSVIDNPDEVLKFGEEHNIHSAPIVVLEDGTILDFTEANKYITTL